MKKLLSIGFILILSLGLTACEKPSFLQKKEIQKLEVKENPTKIQKDAPVLIESETNSIKLPSNLISEKDCQDKGGEVFNTLGETNYEGELIGKIEGLNCPCACLVKNEGSDKKRK